MSSHCSLSRLMWPSEKGGGSPVWSRGSFSTWAGQYGHKLVEMVFMNGLLWNRAGWLEAYSCDMKCWDSLWRAPRSSRWWEPPDPNSCLHAAVLASLPSGNGFPLPKSPQLHRISCGGHLVRIISALKEKIKVSVQDDTTESSWGSAALTSHHQVTKAD